MSHTAPAPQARGHLTTTSIAELLMLALERRLSGSFVFETPVSDKSALVVASGRVTKVRTAELVEPLGRLLTDNGVIDRDTLERGLRLAHERKDRLGDALVQEGAVDRAVLDHTLREQFGRRLTWISELPEASAFGFYANVDFLRDRPECGGDPLSLIWRCIRDGRGGEPRREALLGTLGARALSISPGAALDRFDLLPSEQAAIESLGDRSLPLDELISRCGLEVADARRLVYALLITRQLEPRGDAASSPTLSPRPSVPPAAATVAALRPGASLSQPTAGPPRRVPSDPPAIPGRSQPPERVEHALERASRLVRERARAEGEAQAVEAVREAQIHLSKKQFVEAERLMRTACNADPGNAEYLALHAWLRMQNGELAVPALVLQIVSMLDRAVLKAPMSVAVRLHRAQVLKRLGRDDEAFRDFRFVARRAPDQLDAVREVRLHLIRTRDKQKQSGVFSRLFLR